MSDDPQTTNDKNDVTRSDQPQLRAGEADPRVDDRDGSWPLRFRYKHGERQVVEARPDPARSDWIEYRWPKPQQWAWGAMRAPVFHDNFETIPDVAETEPRLNYQELVDSVRIFLKQWALVRPQIEAQAVMSAIHGAQYSGPTIGNEIQRMERALMALPPHIRQVDPSPSKVEG